MYKRDGHWLVSDKIGLHEAGLQNQVFDEFCKEQCILIYGGQMFCFAFVIPILVLIGRGAYKRWRWQRS